MYLFKISFPQQLNMVSLYTARWVGPRTALFLSLTLAMSLFQKSQNVCLQTTHLFFYLSIFEQLRANNFWQVGQIFSQLYTEYSPIIVTLTIELLEGPCMAKQILEIRKGSSSSQLIINNNTPFLADTNQRGKKTWQSQKINRYYTPYVHEHLLYGGSWATGSSND